MDLSIIEAIYPVTVMNPAAVRDGFTQNIYIPFTPDFVVVKSVMYTPRNADLSTVPPVVLNRHVVVVSNLINESASLGAFTIYFNDSHAAGSYAASDSLHTNLLFKLNKQVHGNYNFSFRDAANGSVSLNGDISIHLEFIKVKYEKPQKFY